MATPGRGTARDLFRERRETPADKPRGRIARTEAGDHVAPGEVEVVQQRKAFLAVVVLEPESRDEAEEHDAERPGVRLWTRGRVRTAAQQFRREITVRSHAERGDVRRYIVRNGFHPATRLVAEDARYAEVADHGVSVGSDKDVLQLHVAVDDALGVNVVQPLADVGEPGGGAFLVHAPPARLVKGRRLAVRREDEIHREVRRARRLVDGEVVDPHDPRV